MGRNLWWVSWNWMKGDSVEAPLDMAGFDAVVSLEADSRDGFVLLTGHLDGQGIQ
jgi:hypothetical protein